MLDKIEVSSILLLRCFNAETEETLLKTLSSMQARFVRQIRSEADRAKLFLKQLDQFSGQIAPLLDSPGLVDKNKLICYIFEHLNDAHRLFNISPTDNFSAVEETKNIFNLKEELCAVSRQIIEWEEANEQAVSRSVVAKLVSPTDVKGVTLLKEVMSHFTSINTITAGFDNGKNHSPKFFSKLQLHIKAAHLELFALLKNQRYTIQPLATDSYGKLKKNFFERQHEAVPGYQKLPKNHYYVTPSRLLANGYYLSGIGTTDCQERRLRYLLTGFKDVMGDYAK